MSNQSFDKNIIIAILAGGFAILVYDVLQISFQFWLHIISFDDWNKQFFPKAFAGIAVMLFALFYALIAKLARIIQNNASSQDSTTDKNDKSLDNKPNPSKDNNKSKKHLSHRTNSIIRNCMTLIVIGAVGYIGFYAYQAYEGKLDTVYTYTTPTLHQEAFWTGKTNNFTFTIPMDYNVRLNTTSLSAQNEIDVDARAVPSTDYKTYVPNQWSSLPQHIYMIFSDAKEYPLKHTPDGSYFDAKIILNKTGDQIGYYHGIGKIYYLFEGKEEGYLPVPFENLTKYNTNGVSYLNVTDVKKDLNPNAIFSVGSSDNTTTLHTNDITLALTYTLVAFGILEFREQLIKGVLWFAELLNRGIC